MTSIHTMIEIPPHPLENPFFDIDTEGRKWCKNTLTQHLETLRKQGITTRNQRRKWNKLNLK